MLTYSLNVQAIHMGFTYCYIAGLSFKVQIYYIMHTKKGEKRKIGIISCHTVFSYGRQIFKLMKLITHMELRSHHDSVVLQSNTKLTPN